MSSRKVAIYGIGFADIDKSCKIKVIVDDHVVYRGTIWSLSKEYLDDDIENLNVNPVILAEWDTLDKEVIHKLKIEVLSGDLLYVDSGVTFLGKSSSKPSEIVHRKITDNLSKIDDPNYNISINGKSVEYIRPPDDKNRGQWDILITENSIFQCDFKVDYGTCDTDPKRFHEIEKYFKTNATNKKTQVDTDINIFPELHRPMWQTYKTLKNEKIKKFITEGLNKAVFESNISEELVKIWKYQKFYELEKQSYEYLHRLGLGDIVPYTTFHDTYCITKKAKVLTKDIVNKNSKFLNHPLYDCLTDNRINNYGVIENRIVFIDYETLDPKMCEYYKHILKIPFIISLE